MAVPTGFDNYETLFTNCVLYLDMNGDAKDATNNNNDGTASGTPSLTTDHLGNANRAYSFDGTGDYITTGYSFTTGSEDFTVAVWFKTASSSNPAGNTVIATQAYPPFHIPLYFDANGYLSCLLRDSGNAAGSNIFVQYTTDIYDATWHFAVLSYVHSSNTAVLYTDGVQRGTNTNATYASHATGKAFGIANGSTSGNSDFPGSIGETFVWERTLSADEVKHLYDLTSKKYIYPYPQQVTE